MIASLFQFCTLHQHNFVALDAPQAHYQCRLAHKPSVQVLLGMSCDYMSCPDPPPLSVRLLILFLRRKERVSQYYCLSFINCRKKMSYVGSADHTSQTLLAATSTTGLILQDRPRSVITWECFYIPIIVRTGPMLLSNL